MKTLLISTSSLWNCGDDFIRNGVLNLLRLRPYTRTLWWNRGYGITASFANDLKINLRSTTYVLIAGTPGWVINNEKLYRHCLHNGIKLSLIGVGLKGGVENTLQKKLMRRIAESGLVEVCMARDTVALRFMEELGFKNAELIPDPAFFVQPVSNERDKNVLCWRDMSEVRNPKRWRRNVKRVKWVLTGKYLARQKTTKMYNKFMQKIFEEMPEPKLVVVHDNREIKPAEKLFGNDKVFYSTDYREILKTYSTAVSFVGSRIHGAIPAAIHGASVHLIYPDIKAVVIEDSLKLLSKYVDNIEQSIKVDYLSKNKIELATVGAAPLNYPALVEAIDKERKRIHQKLKCTTELSTYMQ